MNFCQQKLCVNNTNITFFFREGGLTLAAKMDSFETGETLFSNASSNSLNFNSASAEDKNDIEGAWGSSSYGNVNSTVNLTTDEYLYMYMGPKQVRLKTA